MRLTEVHRKLHHRTVGFFQKLSHSSIRHPRRTLAIVVCVTLIAAPGLSWLKLRTDGHALLAHNAPEVIYDHAIRKQFGIEDPIVVLIRAAHPEGVFNSGTLQLVRDLTARFASMPEINPDNVMSLATEPGLRARPGTFIPQPLLERALDTKAELENLREEIRSIELYTGTFLSADGKSAVILIGSPSVGDRTRLYQSILEIVAERQAGPEEIFVTGAPVAESLLGIHILEDLGVPKTWLGTSTGSYHDPGKGKLPASFYELRLLVARRIGLVPVAALVMMLILYASFRRVLATLLPLPEIAATLVFVFGLMGWLGVPIYLTIAVMPVLLIAVGVTEEIHLFSRYIALLRENPGASHVELLHQTADALVCPIVNASLTTGVGFVSFAFSPLPPVQAFGIFTGIGVLFSLFCSLTAVPAMLTLIDPKRLISPRHGGVPKASRLASWLSSFVLAVGRYRYGVLGLLVIVTALAPWGLRRLVIQDSWIDGFDPDSNFRHATRLVNDQFYGMHLLFVSFDAPELIRGEIPGSALKPDWIVLPPDLAPDIASLSGRSLTIFADGTNTAGPSLISTAAVTASWRTRIEHAVRQGSNTLAYTMRQPADLAARQALTGASHLRFEISGQSHFDPQIIRVIERLGAFIRTRAQYRVGGVLDADDYLRTTRFMVRPGDPNAKAPIARWDEARALWEHYSYARGPHRLRQAVNADYSQSLITIFLKDANFVDTARLMTDIRTYEREHLLPKGIRIGFAGDVAVSQSLIKGIVTTQLQSLFGSLLGIYAVTALFGRSWHWGLYCVAPSTLAVLINFAVMGWFGIPLGVATSMFAGMTLGIGVDFAIHMLEGYERVRAGGASLSEALGRSMALTGPPVLINTIALSLGFGVLMLSQVPANARLGLLMALSLVNCLIASLLILPVLLECFPKAISIPKHQGERD